MSCLIEGIFDLGTQDLPIVKENEIRLQRLRQFREAQSLAELLEKRAEASDWLAHAELSKGGPYGRLVRRNNGDAETPLQFARCLQRSPHRAGDEERVGP